MKEEKYFCPKCESGTYMIGNDFLNTYHSFECCKCRFKIKKETKEELYLELKELCRIAKNKGDN